MLITAAPALTAVAMPRADSEQGIWRVGTGTLSVRAPGQTPRKPTWLAGAAATVVVAVPYKSAGGSAPALVMPEPAISGWPRSICVSTTAISGLAGVTAGGI